MSDTSKKNAIEYLLASMLVILALFLIFHYIPEDSNNEDAYVFPSENSTVVYDVEVESQIGFLVGKISFSIKEVHGDNYILFRRIEQGNIHKLWENSEIVRERGDPIIFEDVIDNSTITGREKIDVGKGSLSIVHYLFENEKTNENITIAMPEDILVPLRVESDSPGGSLSMVLSETNIKPLIL